VIAREATEALESYLATLRKNASVEIDQIRLGKIAAKPPESNTDEDFKKALQSGKPFLLDLEQLLRSLSRVETHS